MLGGIGSFVSSGITLLVFFPRSLISELGYSITSPSVGTPAKAPATSSAEFRQLHGRYPESSAIGKHPSFLQPPPSSSTDSHQDASPEYEAEDMANITRLHSHEGHVRMRVCDSHGAELPSHTDESPYRAQYVFDHRSKSLVRSHSDGHSPGLHPYISGFKSPIDIYDVEEPYDLA
ncbi:hypothetical protein ID866_953 [Astraeus odoratus]|nr:hypothetical protein ID866_953 [Astraeus odoratus]